MAKYKPLPGQPGWGKTEEEKAAAHEEYITGGWGGVTEPTTTPTGATPTITAPEVPPITMPEAPTPPVLPEVPTVPPYEKTPAQIAWEEKFLGKLEPWLEAEGYGIPEETQAKMIQQTTDVLKAREEESLRVMRNNMERRGITNSGFLFANEQTIKSATSVAIAASITDVQIKSALLKMASFEKAMGITAQFVGYLAEESWKAYQPKMAQWEMEAKYGLAEYGVAAEYGIAGYQTQVQVTLAEWQAKFDLTKMELNQAYAQGNIELAAQIAATAAEQQHTWNIEMAEMEMEAANQAAATEGFFGLIGTVAGITL